MGRKGCFGCVGSKGCVRCQGRKVSGYFCFRRSVSLRMFGDEECMIYKVKCRSGTINFKLKSENILCLMACHKEAQDVIVKHVSIQV